MREKGSENMEESESEDERERKWEKEIKIKIRSVREKILISWSREPNERLVKKKETKN